MCTPAPIAIDVPAMFAALDTDKDGVISSKEFGNYLMARGHRLQVCVWPEAMSLLVPALEGERA